MLRRALLATLLASATTPVLFFNSLGRLLGFVPNERRYAMRIYPRSILPVLLLASVALWGANPFVGVWKMNPAKSKYTTESPGPKEPYCHYPGATRRHCC